MFNGVVTFPSSFYALRSEKAAKGANYHCKLIPCPRELSSSCAVSLAFEASLVESIVGIIKENKIKFEAVYIYQGNGLQGEVAEWRG